MKPIFKAVAIITIFSIITRLLGFLFHIYLSRTLGAELLGVHQIAFSFIGVLITLVSSGLPITTAKYCSKYNTSHNISSKAKVVGNSLIIVLFLSLVMCGAVLIFQKLFGLLFAEDKTILIIVTMLPAVVFSGVYAVFRGALWGENKFFLVSITELFEQIVRIIFTVLFIAIIFKNIDINIAVGQAFSLACVCSAILAIILFFCNKGKLSFKKGEYKNIIRSSSPITGIRIASSIVGPLAGIIVPAQLISAGLTSSQAMASYGVMMGMTSPLLYIPITFVGSIGMVMIPNLASLLEDKNYQTISNNVQKSVSITLFLTFLFVPVYLGIGDSIGIILYNNQMSGVLLQKSAIAVVPIAICSLSSSLLNGINLEQKSFYNYCLGAISMLFIVFGFTKFIGIDSVILAIFTCMTIISILNIRLIIKNVPLLKLDLIKKLVFYSLISIPCALIGYFVNGILVNYIPLIFSCLISGLLICCFYFALTKLSGLIDYNILKVKLTRQRT